MKKDNLIARLLVMMLAAAMLISGMGIGVFADDDALAADAQTDELALSGADADTVSDPQAQADITSEDEQVVDGQDTTQDDQQAVEDGTADEETELTEEELAPGVSADPLAAAAPSVICDVTKVTNKSVEPVAAFTWTPEEGVRYDIRIWKGTGEFADNAVASQTDIQPSAENPSVCTFSTAAGQLETGKTYSYQVRAYDITTPEGEGWSDAATFSTKVVTPAAAKGLAVKSTGTTSKALRGSFSWKSSGADVIYKIRVWKGSAAYKAGKKVFIKEGIKKLSFKSDKKKLKPDTWYSFQIGAYYKGGNVVWSAKKSFRFSSEISKATNLKADVPNQGIGVDTDNLITIKWTKPSSGKVGSYAVIRISKDGKKKIMEKGISGSKTKISFRASAGNYKYAIRAYSKKFTDVYKDSKAVKVGEISKYLSEIHEYFEWTATFDRDSTLYKNATGSAKIRTAKKNEEAVCIDKYPGKIAKWDKPSRIKLRFSDGTVGWASFPILSLHPQVAFTMDYPVSLKYDFIKGETSKTDYFIWVNQYTEKVNIFKKSKGGWKLIRVCSCTLANFYQPVSQGYKELGSRAGTVHMLDDKGRDYYFKYARTFHGSGYFHTRSYWTSSNKPKNNVQRRPNTKGCIRLYTEDAKFIYGLPAGTQILIR